MGGIVLTPDQQKLQLAGVLPQHATIAPPPMQSAGLILPGLTAPSKIPADLAKKSVESVKAAPVIGALAQPKPADLGVTTPSVVAPRGTVQGDANELGRLKQTGSGISQIAGKVEGAMPNHPTLGKILGGGLQGLATVGDIGLSAVAPEVAINTPGTQLHHNVLVRGEQRQLAGDEEGAQREAQTANLQAEPVLHQAQADLAQQKQDEVENHHQQQLSSQLASHGFKQDETGNIVPLKYEEMSGDQQAVHDLKASQQELADARSALVKAQKEGIPVAQAQAQARIENATRNSNIAAGRLGLAKITEAAQDTGIDPRTGKPFNGALLDADGNPVGARNAANIRPTGTERTKGDLAQSALDRVSEMKGIVAKHPDYFGPGEGRKTQFQTWIGSQDPDAQTFLSAAQYLADHSAGVFGARAKYITQELSKLTSPTYNPAALNAALDEAARAAKGFKDAGTVHTARTGESENAPAVGTVKEYGGAKYKFKGGDQYDQKNWEKQ